MSSQSYYMNLGLSAINHFASVSSTYRKVAAFIACLFVFALCFLSHLSHADANTGAQQSDLSSHAVEGVTNQIEKNLDLSHEVSYLIDKSGDQSLEKILGKTDWVAAEGKTDFGFNQPVYWFRLDITQYLSDENERLLEILYGLNDEVDVFYVVDGQQVAHYRGGDSVSFTERPLEHRLTIFPLSSRSNYPEFERFEVYTRIQSLGSTKYPILIWDAKAFYKHDSVMDLVRGFLLGAVIVMVVYNLFLFGITRKLSSVIYIVFLLSVAFSMFHIEGYNFQFLWPDTPEINNLGVIIFLGLSYFCSVAFSYTFLSLKYAKPWIRYTGKGLMGLVALWVVLTPFVSYEKIIVPFFMTVALVNLFNPFAGIYQWRKGMRAARFFCLAWMMVILGTLASQLSYAGILPFGILATEGVTIGFIIQMALHSLAFGDQYKEEKDARQKAESAQDAKAQFLAKMSHEIRTPMNGIIGLSELLSFTPLQSQQKYYVDSIQYSGQSLMALINDVLDISKIEAGKMELEAVPAELKEVSAQCLQELQEEARKKAVHLELIYDDDLPVLVKVDVVRLKQILKNFITNAIKYSPSETVEMKVSMKRKTGDVTDVLFEVIDRGSGIPLERMPYLFEPMVQLGISGEDVFGGGGLGLTISRELVLMMQGDIGARNNTGKGATFWCSIPVVSVVAEAEDLGGPEMLEESYGEDEPLEVSVGTVASRVTVLVADDNPVNLAVIKGVLGRLGCDVVAADNGLKAVDTYEDACNEIDLIFMDCEMPEMDGFEATEYIRIYEKRNGLSRVPIVALSAHVLGDISNQCHMAGMDDLISKPVTVEGIDQLLANFFPQFGDLDSGVA